MTFVASVIAKKGVAIIADSLVTTTGPVLSYKDFIEYLQQKSLQSGAANVTLDPSEVSKLFEIRPLSTRNYEEKLFKIDSHTGLTTAGCAEINSKRIAEVIEEIVEKNKKLKTYKLMVTEKRVIRFCKLISREVKEQLKTKPIDSCYFYYTHYNTRSKETEIYEIVVFPNNQSQTPQNWKKYVSYNKTSSLRKIVYGGQNRITEKVLLGDYFSSRKLVQEVIERISVDKKIQITKPEVKKLKDDLGSHENIRMLEIHDLSLQEAVDLAVLLLRIELDFQKYTKDIPTVGGVIKLATIDKKGFKFINGNTIEKPGKIN